LILSAVALLLPAASSAQEISDPLSFRAGFGVAVVPARFNVSWKSTDKSSGNSIFIDSTGTLGLPESEMVPVVYGSYRFASKHSVGFEYFQVNRHATFLSVDEVFGDFRITGDVQIEEDTTFFNIHYGYTLFKDDRSRIHGLVGLNGLDIRYVLDAEGTITPLGEPVTGSTRESTDVEVLLPLFGVDLWYAFTPKWGIGTRVKFVAGETGGTEALVWKTNITSLYKFSKHVSGLLGIAYFDAVVDLDRSREFTEIDYGYDGLSFGLRVSF
jgi:hypothetical protein